MSVRERIRVVLVDDHRLFLDAIVQFLGLHDDVAVVGTAGTIAGLRDVLTAVDADVVLMDYRLPDGDGVSAVAAVRSLRPDAKVVILTGADEDAVMVRAIEAGCAGFVTKDNAAELVISPHTVRNHVQNILGKLEAHSKLEAVSIAVRQGLIRFSS